MTLVPPSTQSWRGLDPAAGAYQAAADRLQLENGNLLAGAGCSFAMSRAFGGDGGARGRTAQQALETLRALGESFE